MNANKLAELQRIGYTIPRTCSFCAHGDFVGFRDYGSCGKHEYEHTGDKRRLGIFTGGTCPEFESSDAKAPYGLWSTFVVNGSST